MWSNYFKTAIRSLWKNKSYVVINTLGMGIALACCITAYLLLAFNFEFDDHLVQQDVETLYRVHTTTDSGNGETLSNINAPYGLGPIVAEEIPWVEDYFRYQFNFGFVRYQDKSFGEGISMVDPSFVELYPLETVSGSLNSFKEKSRVVLSQEYAEKYFPEENPIDKVLTFYFDNEHVVQGTVGAVVKDAPYNSSIKFNILMNTSHFQDIYRISNTEMGYWRDPTLFVKVREAAEVSQFTELTGTHIANRNRLKEDAKARSFHLEPFLKSINQDDVGWSQINTRMSFTPIMIFITMALMILLIACFNLTNTTIATSAKRTKELGIRKVVGATRSQLIIQLLLEMLITIFISMIVGIALSNILVGEFANLWDMPFGLKDINGFNLLIALFVLVISSSLLAGLYPALRGSAFRPIVLIRNKGSIASYNVVSRVLVTVQFAISVIVLLNGLVFIQNTKYQEGIDFGFNLDNIYGIYIQSKSEYEVMSQQLKMIPQIEEVGVTHHQLGLSSYGFPVKVDTSEYNVRHIEVGERFFEIMGLSLSQGRFLNASLISDQQDAIVVNEEFLKHTNLGENPIGQYVQVRDQKKKIVGVVENHVDNLFRTAESEPFVYYVSKPNELQMILVKGNPSDLVTISDEARAIWEKEFPSKPFQGEFQDELTLGNLRQTNSNLKKIFLFLTLLGGLLSLAGIYALATLHTEKRTKEIGIRKALGGNVKHILFLLSKEFSLILGFAVLFGLGFGYMLCNALLNEIYALHVDVNFMPMFFSGIIILLAGFCTTSMITLKAATANPVDSLRDE